MYFYRKMRTVSVRMTCDRDGVENITMTQMLARDRQQRFEHTAANYRLQRQVPWPHRAPVRTGTGWLLVRVGLRLAHIDPFMPAAARSKLKPLGLEAAGTS